MTEFTIGDMVKNHTDCSSALAGEVVKVHKPPYRQQTVDVQWYERKGADRLRKKPGFLRSMLRPKRTRKTPTFIEKRVPSRFLRRLTQLERRD